MCPARGASPAAAAAVVSTDARRPRGLRRLAAIAAIVLVVAVVVATLVGAVGEPLRVVVELLLLVLFLVAGWFWLTISAGRVLLTRAREHRGARRDDGGRRR